MTMTMAVSPQAQQTQATASVLTGAEILLQSLVAHEVETIFGLPGGVILPIYDALPSYPLRHILVRHEQGAVHMAEGYARATGKTGVVLVTSGPGATNTLTGIADAYYDSVPLVVLTGNVATHMLGNDSFQEADIVGMTRSCTKHNVMVRCVEELADALHEAFYIANTGRPGPVLVDLPKDVLIAKTVFEPGPRSLDLPGYQLSEAAHDADLEAIMAILETARQPLILSGGGVVASGAHALLRQFAERFEIPVACSLMGLGSFPADHPLSLGFAGMHGHYWSNIAVANADVLLVIGNRLNERQTGKTDRFARHARIIHIDLDPTTLEKNVETCLPVQGDIQDVLARLLQKTNDMTPFQNSLASRHAWFQQIETWKKRRAVTPPCMDYLDPKYVIERLFHWLPADAFVTTEVGQHQMWTAQRFNLSRPRSFISSGGLGTMGFGFPAAIGVQAAFPNHVVLDIAGDGSFQMTLQELATARDNQLPVKVAIINNNHLGMIRQWQGKMFKGECEARLTSPDYVKLAEAYGCVGFVVTHPSQVDDVIQQAYAIQDRPVLIDFQVFERADVYPWVPGGRSNEEMWEETEQNNHGKEPVQS